MGIYNINRDYLISVNLKNAQVTSQSMSFYNTDKGIANLFVKLQVAMSQDLDIKQYVSMESASNYRVKLLAIKPKTKGIVELEGVVMNPSADGNNAVYLFDMPTNFTDQVGVYPSQLKITCTVNGKEEVITSDPFAYTVKQDITTGLNYEIEQSP